MGRTALSLAVLLMLAACADGEGMSVEADDPVPYVDPVENPDTGLECAGDRAECMEQDILGE